MKRMDAFGALEQRLQNIGGRRPFLLAARLSWLAAACALLLSRGWEASEGLLLVAFIQLASVGVHALPSHLWRGRPFRTCVVAGDFALAAASFYLLNWQGSGLFLALVSFFLLGASAVTLRFLLFSTSVFMLFAPLLAGQTPVDPAGVLWRATALTALLFLAGGVYVSVYLLPVNPFALAIGRSMRMAAWRRRNADFLDRVCMAESVADVNRAVGVSLSESFPDAHIQVLALGERTEILNEFGLPVKDPGDFSGEFNRSLADDCVVWFEPPGSDAVPPVGTAAVQPPPPGRATGFAIPLSSARGAGRGAAAVAVFPDFRPVSLEAADFAEMVRANVPPHLRRCAGSEDARAETRDLNAHLLSARRERDEFHSSIRLLTDLCRSSDVRQQVQFLDSAFRKFIESDVTMVFFKVPQSGGKPEGLVLEHLCAKKGFPLERGWRTPLAGTKIGDAVRDNKVIFVGVLKEPSEGDSPLASDLDTLLRSDVRSLLVLPLGIGREVAGCLAMGSHQAGRFRAEHTSWLGLLQPAVGWVLSSTREIERGSKECAANRAALSVCAAAVRGERDGRMLSAASLAMQADFPWDFFRFSLLDRRGENLTPVAGDAYFDPGGEPPTPAGANDLAASSARERRTLTCRNTRGDASCHRLSDRVATRVACPVTFGDEVFGVLDAAVYREDALSEADVYAMEAVVGVLGLAMSHARRGEHRPGKSAEDPMTGLRDRRAFVERLRDQCSKSVGQPKPFCVILADIDDLSKINSDAGLDSGDEAIRSVAAILAAEAPAPAFTARLGADEFGILLPDTPLDQGVMAGRRVLESARRVTLARGAGVRLSIGLAASPEHGVQESDLWGRAEKSLAEAKKNGKDTLCFPEEILVLVGNSRRTLQTGELFREVAGPDGLAGSHSVEKLQGVLSRMEEWGLDPVMAADVLHRMILKLDYPQRPMDYFNLVPEISSQMGRDLKLGAAKIKEIQTAAKIYDIGKFVLDQSLLHAPRGLNEAERQQVAQHVGTVIKTVVQPHKMFTPFLPTIKFHHERWDGSGYPWRLKGDEIPVEAQIVGLADVFKALVTERPYRRPMPPAEAVQYLMGYRDVLFEGRLMDVLAQVVARLDIS